MFIIYIYIIHHVDQLLIISEIMKIIIGHRADQIKLITSPAHILPAWAAGPAVFGISGQRGTNIKLWAVKIFATIYLRKFYENAKLANINGRE